MGVLFEETVEKGSELMGDRKGRDWSEAMKTAEGWRDRDGDSDGASGGRNPQTWSQLAAFLACSGCLALTQVRCSAESRGREGKPQKKHLGVAVG